jgi:hypothetical protein
MGRSDDYLLHSVVCNPDSPPQVTELLLALNPSSALRCLPNTELLPLHLAALTPPYVPCDFEVQTRGALELIVRAHPAAAGCASEIGFPLHMAIKSDRSWNELHLLVEADPTILLRRDPGTGLVPFQLAALSHSAPAEIYSRCQTLAVNRFGESKWESLPPLQQVSEVRDEYRRQRLAVLTRVFELLRRDASAIGGTGNLGIGSSAGDSVIDGKHAVTVEGFRFTGVDSANQALPLPSDPEEDSAMDDSTDNELDSECDESDRGPRKKQEAATERPSLLTYFERTASQKSVCGSRHRGDASVISGVDVMSLVSGPGSLVPRVRPGRSVASGDRSIDLADLLLDQETSDESSSDESCDDEESSDEFAEESTNADGDLS